MRMEALRVAAMSRSCCCCSEPVVCDALEMLGEELPGFSGGG